MLLLVNQTSASNNKATITRISDKDIKEFPRSCHFYLFKLRSVGYYLDRPSKIKLVQSHILIKIDY